MASHSTRDTAPPKAPSLKQKHYVDSLARQCGYADGQAFYRAWAGKNRRGFITWNRRTVHLAIGELKRRIAAQDPQHPPQQGISALNAEPMPTPNAATAIAA